MSDLRVLGPQRIAVVTGGSSGIGLSVARRLARAGNDVWILARNAARLQDAVRLLENDRLMHEQRISSLEVDVAQSAQVFTAMESIQREWGTPDLVINSAGQALPGYVNELNLETFHELMDVNYYGSVYTTKSVLPGMLERGSGHLVFISSMGGLISIFGYTAYSASKFALHGFAGALRQEMKPHGIRVSIVAPPDTDTPQLAYENQFKPPETRALASNASIVSPDFVAEKLLRGVARGQYLIIPDFRCNLFYGLKRLLGSRFDWAMDLIVAQARRNGR
jgi:3-dehydrosphinganine reductase